MLGVVSIGILILLFLPVYFITGIRQPDARVNTVVSSVLMITACALFLALARTPHSSYSIKRNQTAYYLRNEQLLSNERAVIKSLNPDAEAINGLCEQIKSVFIESQTGVKKPDWNTAVLSDDRAGIMDDNTQVKQLVNELKIQINSYNKKLVTNESVFELPQSIPLLQDNDYRTLPALNDLVQIQMFLVQNQEKHSN